MSDDRVILETAKSKYDDQPYLSFKVRCAILQDQKKKLEAEIERLMQLKPPAEFEHIEWLLKSAETLMMAAKWCVDAKLSGSIPASTVDRDGSK